MTADVIEMSARHSWDRQPRKDDPSRSVYTCRRDACGLKRRSEFDGQERIQLWLWPDGETGRGKNYPPCRGGEVVPVASEPAVVLPPLELVPAPVEESPQPSVVDASVKRCVRCNPPCGRPGRLHLGGISCVEAVAAAGAATREWIRDMRSNGGAA